MPISPKRSVLLVNEYPTPINDRRNYVRLDLGENTACPQEWYPPDVKPHDVSLYPEYRSLNEKLAAVFAVSAENFLITNGSDEGLVLISNTFIEPGEDRAIVSHPSFVVMAQSLVLSGANLVTVSTCPDLEFDTDALTKQLAAHPVKVAMFASPDNPTGKLLSEETVRKWCGQFPKTLFVIDEAYFEYSNLSVLHCINEFDNLLVTRTFSKAWGMAGLRLGVVFGHVDLISYLKRSRLLFNVNSAAVRVALNLLDKQEQVLSEAKETMKHKCALVTALRERCFEIIDGHANFFLLGAGLYAAEITEHLKSKGILVRNMSRGPRPGESPLWGFLKVCAGQPEENQRLLSALDDFRDTHAIAFDLDGTLIDTTESYDFAISELVLAYSGKPLVHGEIEALQEGGGFNDSWDKARELVRRRGKEVPREQLVREGQQIYLRVARKSERLMFDMDLIKRLRMRFKLFIVTGRTRAEYDATWATELDKLFDRVYCRDDIAGLLPKPAPDYLTTARQEFLLTSGMYVGNTVDDMWCARDAGFFKVGVTSTHDDALLKSAGADITLSGVDELKKLLLC